MPPMNWRYIPVSSSKKQSTSNSKTTDTSDKTSLALKGNAAARRARRTIRSAIEEYITDHKAQHHSPKTIEWHSYALGNLVDFLEKQGVTRLEQLEKVHLLAWISKLMDEPGERGRMLSARTVNGYARSMRAFCRWLESEGYVDVAPSSRVKMPKYGKPLIRIIEFDEFERMLKACTPPQ